MARHFRRQGLTAQVSATFRGQQHARLFKESPISRQLFDPLLQPGGDFSPGAAIAELSRRLAYQVGGWRPKRRARDYQKPVIQFFVRDQTDPPIWIAARSRPVGASCDPQELLRVGYHRSIPCGLRARTNESLSDVGADPPDSERGPQPLDHDLEVNGLFDLDDPLDQSCEKVSRDRHRIFNGGMAIESPVLVKQGRGLLQRSVLWWISVMRFCLLGALIARVFSGFRRRSGCVRRSRSREFERVLNRSELGLRTANP